MSNQQTQTAKSSSNFLRPLKACLLPVVMALSIGGSSILSSAQAADGMEELKQVLKGQIDMMKPELADKVKVYQPTPRCS